MTSAGLENTMYILTSCSRQNSFETGIDDFFPIQFNLQNPIYFFYQTSLWKMLFRYLLAVQERTLLKQQMKIFFPASLICKIQYIFFDSTYLWKILCRYLLAVQDRTLFKQELSIFSSQFNLQNPIIFFIRLLCPCIQIMQFPHHTANRQPDT